MTPILGSPNLAAAEIFLPLTPSIQSSNMAVGNTSIAAPMTTSFTPIAANTSIGIDLGGLDFADSLK